MKYLNEVEIVTIFILDLQASKTICGKNVLLAVGVLDIQPDNIHRQIVLVEASVHLKRSLHTHTTTGTSYIRVTLGEEEIKMQNFETRE